MRVGLLVLVLAGSPPGAAQDPITSPTPDWVSTGSGPGAQGSSGISYGPGLTAAMVGTFTGETRFGPLTLAAGTEAGAQAVFVVQFDAEGTPQWARQIGSENGEAASGDVSIDWDGHVVVSGSFAGEATVDGGMARDTTLVSRGGRDAFLARFSSTGDLVWAQQIGGAGDDVGYGLDVDVDGVVVLAGAFEGTATWGAGAEAQTDSSRGATDGFVAEVLPDGTLRGLLTVGGPGHDEVRDVSYDFWWPDRNRLAVVGTFEETAVLGDTTLTSRGATDVFALDFKGHSTMFDALHIGGPGADRAAGVALATTYGSQIGHLVVAGTFEDSLSVETKQLVSAGRTDAFLIGLWSWNGEHFITGIRAGGPEADGSTDVAFAVGFYGDVSAAVPVLSGYYSGTASFSFDDPYMNPPFLTSQGGMDGFVLTFDAFYPYALVSIGGSGDDAVQAVSGTGYLSGAFGRALISGTFQGSATIGTQPISGTAGDDVYLADFAEGALVPFYVDTAPPPTRLQVTLAVSPNPARGAATATVTLDAPADLRVEVVDMLGRRLGVVHHGAVAAGQTRFPLSLDSLPPGVYAVRVVGRGATTRPFVVTR